MQIIMINTTKLCWAHGMTFSILTFDSKTGVFAAAAATGSLCVGGWVLRGDIESGLVASQGTAPSTFWRDDVLRAMHQGQSAGEAVEAVTRRDPGRGHRQLIALDRRGRAHGFTGADSVAYANHITQPGMAIAGNMLEGPGVLEAMLSAAPADELSADDRMLRVLTAAKQAGGDSRGLLSAALLVLAPDRPPLDLRIDHSDDPISELERLCRRTRQSPYFDWLSEVPVLLEKARAPE
jgi:uncharacterized Ntn-hydrolase superfamily protein